jgi:hypothetical protein
MGETETADIEWLRIEHSRTLAQLDALADELRDLGIMLTIPSEEIPPPCLGWMIVHVDTDGAVAGIAELVPRCSLDDDQRWRLMVTARKVWPDLGVGGSRRPQLNSTGGWARLANHNVGVLGIF